VASDGRGALDIEFRLVARAAGEVVERYERTFTAKVPPDGIEALRRSLRAEGRLALPPGVYELQGTLRLLEPPQLASWTSTLAVPPQSREGSLAIGAAFLVADREPVSPLVSRPEIPGDADPLTLSAGGRVLPPTTVDFETGSAMDVVFWIRGVPLVDGKPKLDLSIHVLDAEGKVIEAPSQLALFMPEPTGGYRALARIDARALAPGSYGVRVEARPASDPAGSATRRTIPFSLRAREAGGPAPAGATPTASSAP
jgi:hypothetical protein